MEDGWISREERLPGPEDADAMNCVAAWHLYQGFMVTGWRNVRDNKLFSDWMRPPAKPKRLCEEQA